MTHVAATEVSLPPTCLALPDRAQQLLTTLVSFARSYAIRQGHASATEIQFHLPQYVLARTMGVHEDTVRRWLNRPEAQYVVRRCAYKQDGRHQRITSGTIFSVRLYPDGRTRPKLRFERGKTYRDLEQARSQGRVRDTYSPGTKSLFQALGDWVQEPVSPREEDPPVNVPRMPVNNPIEAVQDALLTASAELVQRAGHAIVQALGDSPAFLPAWYRLLWNLARHNDSRTQALFTTTFARFHAGHREGLHHAGALLLREARTAGWR